MKLIIRIVINAIAIWITTMLLAGLNFSGSVFNLLLVGVIFGLINAFIRPLILLLTLPLTLVTLGLFTLVINTLMLMLTVWISDNLELTGGAFESTVTAFVAAIIISIISLVLSWFVPD